MMFVNMLAGSIAATAVRGRSGLLTEPVASQSLLASERRHTERPAPYNQVCCAAWRHSSNAARIRGLAHLPRLETVVKGMALPSLDWGSLKCCNAAIALQKRCFR